MLEIETRLFTAFHLQIDGQTERMNQELEQYFCRAQTEELARVVGISRVCGEQQGSYGNKSFAFYGKLQKKVENRKRYKKKEEGRECDGICGKNEKGT